MALSFSIRHWDLLYGVEIQCMALSFGIWRWDLLNGVEIRCTV